MVHFLLKALFNKIILAVYHDFRWLLVATKLLTVKLHSLYVKESESEILERSESGGENFGKVGVGVGHFTFDSATLIVCLGQSAVCQLRIILWRQAPGEKINEIQNACPAQAFSEPGVHRIQRSNRCDGWGVTRRPCACRPTLMPKACNFVPCSICCQFETTFDLPRMTDPARNISSR